MVIKIESGSDHMTEMSTNSQRGRNLKGEGYKRFRTGSKTYPRPGDYPVLSKEKTFID